MQNSTATTTATTIATQATGDSSDYLDDRSAAGALIESYYNAIDRHEYSRAYAYWEPGVSDTQLAPFEQFQQGYVTTASVALTLGAIGSDVGAGQLYFSVPVVLDASMTDGSSTYYVGCYALHLGRPEIQTAPPFQPLAIQSATVNVASSAAEAQSKLGDACAALGSSAPAPTVAPTTSPASIAATTYIDNRSTPETVLDSLYNAVNRQEYARAYGYWTSAATGRAPFDQFRQGYADTNAVTLTFGVTLADPGAGQLNYSQPVAVRATQSDGSTHTFVGCYKLHLTQPALQAQPPFQPLAIESGDLNEVDNGADIATLLTTSCQP